jgi:hypothetical protein
MWRVDRFDKTEKLFPFVGIEKDAQGNARLYNFDSFVRTVNPKTGELIRSEYIK